MAKIRKQRKLQKIVEEDNYVTLLLDAQRERDKITGVRFDGRLIYQGSPYSSATKGWGYYLEINTIASDFPKERIRLFSKELIIKYDLWDVMLLSFTNSDTRGTPSNKKITGREEKYGLAPEYISPRETFPDRIFEIPL